MIVPKMVPAHKRINQVENLSEDVIMLSIRVLTVFCRAKGLFLDALFMMDDQTEILNL